MSEDDQLSLLTADDKPGFWYCRCCRGNGEIDGDRCPVCQGSGRVPFDPEDLSSIPF